MAIKWTVGDSDDSQRADLPCGIVRVFWTEERRGGATIPGYKVAVGTRTLKTLSPSMDNGKFRAVELARKIAMETLAMMDATGDQA